MKQVELVRARILRGFEGEMNRLRVHLSMFESGTEMVDRLRSPDTRELLAMITDLTLSHLGHDPAKHTRNGGKTLTAADAGSASRRAASRQ